MRWISWCAAAAGVLAMNAAQADNPEVVRELLSNPKMEQLYGRTYQSLVDRVEPDGFFQESLTGAYAGMFPRTVGALVSLFAETGEWKRARDVVDMCFRAARDHELDRNLHVFDRPVHHQPVEQSDVAVNVKQDIALYRLDAPYIGAQRFIAGSKPVRAIEALITGAMRGEMQVQLMAHLDKGPVYAQTTLTVNDNKSSLRWLRMAFPKPAVLPAGETVWITLQWKGEGRPVWFGLANAPGNPLAGGAAYDPGHWLNHPGHLTAFAVDTGSLKHRRSAGRTLLISRMDQLDGNLHVIWGWAKVAENGVDPKWADRTWKQAARLMDVASDWPYLPPQAPPMWPGLARNICLEHSRETRYWDTHDLLTNCWMAEALRAMAAEAAKRGDTARARTWTQRLQALEQAMHNHLVMELDGKKVYAEMRLPNGRDGVIFDGLSWVNWSPWQTDWKGADPAILRNTLDAARKRMDTVWNGHVIVLDEWGPDGRVAQQVIGKGVGWDIEASLQYGQWDRIAHWLRFLLEENKAELYAEAFNLIDGKMVMQDPGNGEQAAWWCRGIARLRKAVGLPVVPATVK